MHQFWIFHRKTFFTLKDPTDQFHDDIISLQLPRFIRSCIFHFSLNFVNLMESIRRKQIRKDSRRSQMTPLWKWPIFDINTGQKKVKGQISNPNFPTLCTGRGKCVWYCGVLIFSNWNVSLEKKSMSGFFCSLRGCLCVVVSLSVSMTTVVSLQLCR